ncbi:MAG: class I SAM-dependent DNA methyltransferase [Candidatus Omnitrophica bacterium]|nr:class I SAM-dependent DNA methyltransferase [Candidatus Omnitrophota bacterium]MDD5042327.1 class I SAM-dependent DNA methyltransferase [Candidatus Omnitrophota bacterium]MDD5500448.1 class I SAM-dependent DNA methyltransferase [Candidatus Omnitrophota bacterium]
MSRAKESKNVKKTEPFEATLWQSADKLRKNIDAGEYKHVLLGLIFLKYISDAFEVLHSQLVQGKGEYEGADPEDPNEYTAEKVFFVPPIARWKRISDNAKKTEILLDNGKKVDIGGYVDEAMEAIERQNHSLKGVLPKVFARQNLDRAGLGGLIDLVGTIVLGTAEAKSKDLLGQVYEYFLGQFALAEGKKGGQFYTPRSVVKLLVEMLQPYEGRVFDPCCGSGGMFVQSEKFITAHQDRYKKKSKSVSLDPSDMISIYGQESNQTTWRLAKMNLAIRGIDSSNVKWNNEGSFLNDAHKDLKADFILANPPFNDSDWSGDLLKDDARWKYGIPPSGNANYAWIQHFIYHLSPSGGMAGFVLAKGSLTSKTNSEGEIRKAIIEAGLLDCIVNLPAKLFLNTQIPACLWFLSRKKEGRLDKVLFIDSRNLGYLINRRTRDFKDADIAKIAETYHHWRNKNAEYKDIPGFCKSVPLEEIRQKDYVLTPGRYIGLPEEEDDFDFAERFTKLKAELDEQMKEEIKLNEVILKNLAKIEVPDVGVHR